MSSCTKTARSDILVATHPLARCHARKHSCSPTDANNTAMEEEIKDIENLSSLALRAVDSIIVEKRRRTRSALRHAIPDYSMSRSAAFEEEDVDVGIEELGTLGLRTVDSVDLIRQDGEKNGTASAKSRTRRKNKVRDWLLGMWFRV